MSIAISEQRPCVSIGWRRADSGKGFLAFCECGWARMAGDKDEASLLALGHRLLVKQIWYERG